MARARNIKPGFFKNDVLVELSFEHRLLFIGLWTIADREGRLEDRPIKIRMEVFPADNVDVESGLQGLHDRGFIERYEADGGRYIQILAWGKHQNPHVKEAKSTIPAPCSHRAGTVQASESKEQAPPFPERAGLIPDSLIPDSTDEPPIGGLSPATAAPLPEDPPWQSEETDPPGIPPCPVKRIIAAYHEALPELPAVRAFPDQAERMLRTRWREEPERQTVEWWRSFFGYVQTCPFLVGGRTDFTADLIWLVRPSNFAKVLNGNYEARKEAAHA